MNAAPCAPLPAGVEPNCLSSAPIGAFDAAVAAGTTSITGARSKFTPAARSSRAQPAAAERSVARRPRALGQRGRHHGKAGPGQVLDLAALLVGGDEHPHAAVVRGAQRLHVRGRGGQRRDAFRRRVEQQRPEVVPLQRRRRLRSGDCRPSRRRGTAGQPAAPRSAARRPGPRRIPRARATLVTGTPCLASSSRPAGGATRRTARPGPPASCSPRSTASTAPAATRARHKRPRARSSPVPVHGTTLVASRVRRSPEVVVAARLQRGI